MRAVNPVNPVRCFRRSVVASQKMGCALAAAQPEFGAFKLGSLAVSSGERSMSFVEQYLEETRQVAAGLPVADLEKMVDELARVRDRGGRLFILGVGGSAANASHAVNDFRKICGFECYAPTDNVAE